MRSLKYFLICLGVVFIPRSVLADIEPINVVVKNAVAAVEEGQKYYYDIKAQYDQLNDLYTSGRKALDDAENTFNKIKSNIEGVTADPKGMLSTFLLEGTENVGPEPEFERMNKVKHYSRKWGEDSIAAQKELNKAMNEEKFKGLSTLFARSITKRRALLNEESTEPDLSTVAAAQKAIADKLIQSSRRLSYLLQSDAFVKAYLYTIEIQGYNIQEEEEDEE